VKLFVAAAGPLGVPVAEELVRACWSIEALYYDAASPQRAVYENFQKRVSFPIRPVAHADWALLWSSLPQDDAMLFLIGCPEPANPQGFKDIYALQAGLLPSQAGPDAASWARWRGATPRRASRSTGAARNPTAASCSSRNPAPSPTATTRALSARN
jgi:hypothetical protein